jgi:hypothetical protein
MASVASTAVQVTAGGVIELLLGPLTAIGTGVAVLSGGLGATALIIGRPREGLSQLVDEGVAVGFLMSLPLALFILGAGLFSGHA